MSKKKIISLCLVVCLLATAIGGTLAYFTDTDNQVKNTFTVGNVSIDLTETNKINGVDVTGNAFEKVMPGTVITKTPVVTNNSSEAAYVRVVVRVTNQEELYDILDAKDEDGNAKYNVNDIFKGWNFTFDKVGGMRYTSTRTPDTANGVTLIAVDEGVGSNRGGNTLISADNYFKTETETNLVATGTSTVNGFSKDGGNRIVIHAASLSHDVINNASNYIYYQDLVGVYKTASVAWIYYLKMEPNTSYTLFEGINIPAEFDTAEMAFFKDLEIDVCADAIQSTGFGTDAKAAFEALNEAHPLSAWGLK